jgi:hypothetical protein
MTNVSCSGNNHKEARSGSRSYINCNVFSVNEYDKAAKTLSVTFLAYLQRFGRQWEARIRVHVGS